MKINKKLVAIVVIVSIVFITILAGIRALQEKYCYNYGFLELEKQGIKLGEKVPEELKGYSPLEVSSTTGNKEWWDGYMRCNREFNLFGVDISVLQKSYPDYEHFIDL